MISRAKMSLSVKKNKKLLLLAGLFGVLDHAQAGVESSELFEPSGNSLQDVGASKKVKVFLDNVEDINLVRSLIDDIKEENLGDEELLSRLELLQLEVGDSIECQANAALQDACIYLLKQDGKFYFYSDGELVELNATGLSNIQATRVVTSDPSEGRSDVTVSLSNTEVLIEDDSDSDFSNNSEMSVPVKVGIGMTTLGVLSLAGDGNDDNSGSGNVIPEKSTAAAPTNIALSAVSVSENASGAVVGTLTITDPDAGDTHTLTVDDTRFEVMSGQLKLKDAVSLDHEETDSVDLMVTTTDSAGLSLSQVFTITVTDANEAPNNIALSAVSVSENASGAVVGTLTITDPDAGDTHTLTVDDTRFEVMSGQLKLKDAVSLDHEEADSVDLMVTATDSAGLSLPQVFTITVTDANEAPNNIALSAVSVSENASGAVVGTLTITDPDADDTHTLTVDDTRFEVVSGQLKLKNAVSLDHEAADSIDVTVTAIDSYGLSLSQVFTITVNDINDVPTNIALSAVSVNENSSGAVVGTLTITDPDADDTHTLTVDDTRFEVVSGKLKLKNAVSLDHEAAGSVDVLVTATDPDGLSLSQVFTITVNDVVNDVVNDAPTNIALSAVGVNENSSGAVVGTLTIIAPDAGDTHTLTVDDTRFEVVSGQLKLKNAVSLDHEEADSVDVMVTATDAGGLSHSQTFTITIVDVAETTSISGTSEVDTIDFPSGLDDFIIQTLAGDDIINTGNGNDIIRSGEGVDTVNTGAGNDIVVVAGQTAVGQYDQNDINNPGGSGIDLSSVITLDDLNGRILSEVVSGESIDGGAGSNRLVIYGNVDFTGVTLTNINQFQVNSTLTISAQQLNVLGPNLIFGDGESVINITNESSDPVTVDLSGVSFSDFKTLNLSANITLIVDQADVDDLLYLSGAGTLQASEATGNLNLASKYTTLIIRDKDAVVDADHGAVIVSGDLLVASEAGETLTGGDDADRLLGGDGNDILNGDAGDDILRGGQGVDEMNGGDGDDRFVIVGDLSGGGKIDSDEDTAALGFPLTTLNGKTFAEDVGGGIRGGEGNDTLFVYGTADLSDWDIEGIEHVVIRSDVTFTVRQLKSLQSVRGDGGSTVRIEPNAEPDELDFAQLNLSEINHIEVGINVTVTVDDVSSFGGAELVSGAGSILGSNPTLDLSGMNITRTIDARGNNDSLAQGATYIDTVVTESTGDVTTRTGTTGNDVINGTANGESMLGLAGADKLIGADGNDFLFGDDQVIPIFSVDESSTPPTVVGSNYLVNGLGGSAGFGEEVLQRNDDGSSGAINITSVFGEDGLNFFGRTFTSLYVNNNGNITFASPLSQFTPGVINAGIDNPIITPFWGDVDTRSGVVSSTPGGNSTGTNLVYYDLDEENKTFTVTWDDVGYYSSRADKLNAFQLQLKATENGNFDIVYRYEDINWTTGDASDGSGGLGGSVARAGYSAGNENGYYEMPQSGDQAQMLALDEDGNYVFTVRNGITLDSSNNDELIGGSGDDVLVGGDGVDTAEFSGSITRNSNGDIEGEYDFERIGNTLVVKDTVLGRDGNDTLFFDVEKLKFNGSGQTFDLSDFVDLSISTGGMGMPEDVSEKVSILAKFAQASYWTRPDDLTLGVTKEYVYEDGEYTTALLSTDEDDVLPNHVSAGNSGQELYNWLKSDAGGWIFLAPSELSTDLEALTVERDDGNGGQNVYYEAGTVEQARDSSHSIVNDQSLLHGSGSAIVAKSGSDMVISFRGTEDVEGFIPSVNEDPNYNYNSEGIIPEKLHSVTKALVTYILETKYNMSAEYIEGTDPQHTQATRLLAAKNIYDFIIAVGDSLTGGSLTKVLDNRVVETVISLLDDFDFELYNTIKEAKGNAISQIAELAIMPVVKTDSYYWIQQDEGYELFKPLIESLKNNVLENPEITHLYVSGHSLGAAMASWFVTDPDGGIAIHETLKERGGGVEGVVFAAPGVVMNSVTELSDRMDAFNNSNIEHTRFEVTRDLVADVTQVAQAGSEAVPLHAFQPGQQINLQTTISPLAYKEMVGQLHSMANYRDAVTLMNETSMLDDLSFLEMNTNFIGSDDGLRSDPVVITQLRDLTKVGDVAAANGQYDNGVIITGDNSKKYFGEFLYAEKLSKHDIIIGTPQNDILIGDSSKTTTEGLNNIFYIGSGFDNVYGNMRGGTYVYNVIDTVVYDFKDTLIYSDQINQGNISGSRYEQEPIEINIDGTSDTFNSVEQIHFVDSSVINEYDDINENNVITASNDRNMLVGTSDKDLIEVFGGDDYVYGRAEDDTVLVNGGNNRIHGGDGNDTAIFDGNYTDYSFSVKNLTLEVTNTVSGGRDNLYSVESIKIGDDIALVSDVLWLDQYAFSSDPVITNSLSYELLWMYAPVINIYSEEGAINEHYSYNVYGEMKGNSLLYKISFEDIDNGLGDIDHGNMGSSFLRIDLLNNLPEYYVSKSNVRDGNSSGEVQVRNAFDSELSFIGNNILTYIDENETGRDNDSWYLTNEVGNQSKTQSWLYPNLIDFSNNEKLVKSTDAKDGLGNSLSLPSSSISYYDLILNEELDWDAVDRFDDDDGLNNLYEIENDVPYKLAGLETGDMAMGFLFDNSSIAPLGHYDVV